MATLTGTQENDTLGPLGTDDHLFGLSGNDRLLGGGGNDTLEGGAGVWSKNSDGDATNYGDNDVINGGSGDDLIVIGAGVDTIIGGVGTDRISFGRLYTVTHNNTNISFPPVFPQEVVINLSSGAYAIVKFLDSRRQPIDFVANGTLSGIESADGVNGNDILIGSDVANVLNGLAGNDTIEGRDGTDTLDGGFGNDRIDGNEGNDTIAGGVGDDTINAGTGEDILSGGAGVDGIDGGDGDDLVVYSEEGGTQGAMVDLANGATSTDTFGDTDLLRNIENVRGSEFGDAITGSDAINVLSGGNGDDTISGLGGEDIFHGGSGNDTIDGGDGVDLIIYLDEGGTGGVTVLLANAQAGTDTFGYTDVLRNIENVRGSAFDDTINGNDADNMIGGREGKDAIEGFNGADALFGGEGDDRIGGGFGADTLYGENGNDVMGGGRDDDALDGGEGDDQLLGDAGLDRMFGAAGEDTLTGGASDDSLTGGADADRLRDTEYDGGVDSLTEEGVEQGLGNTLLGGSGNDILFGAGLLDGGTENDKIRGEGVLIGGDGNDRLTAAVVEGAAASAKLVGGLGNDILEEFDDSLLFDRVFAVASYEYSAVGVTVALQNGIASGADGDQDRLRNIHSVDGSNFGDRLIGLDGEYDALTGLDGDDVIKGLSGDDLGDGGNGNDTIYGGLGADRLIGLDGNDTIHTGSSRGTTTTNGLDIAIGGNGDDTIIYEGGWAELSGRAGSDTLIARGQRGELEMIGGENTDLFVIEASIRNLSMTISDFDKRSERIDISAFGFANLQALKAVAHGGADFVSFALSDATSLRLDGMTLELLRADDFIFV